MSNLKKFQKIYPFTTENNSYIEQLDVKDKSVLTVGSSCDQALNSLLLGAKEITVFDINERVKEFYEIKKRLIFEVPRRQLVEKVLDSKQFSFSSDIFTGRQLELMNLYLQSDANYQRLRNILEEKTINFVTGNIFDVSSSLNQNEKYDRVILSNVLQSDYLPSKDIPVEEIIYDVYSNISKYLSEEFIVQLYYLYGSIYPSRFVKVADIFDKNNLSLERVFCDKKDSAVFVKKKTM